MTKKSKRLEVVLTLAERDQEEAAKALERNRLCLEGERAKLAELDKYSQDYETQFLDHAHLRAPELIRQRGFLSQLADIRRQQHQSIRRFERQVEHDKKIWHQTHIKVKAVSSVIEKCVEDEDAILNKEEEKRLDEWAIQSFNRRV